MASGTQASAASRTSGSTIASPAKSFAHDSEISDFFIVAWRAVSAAPPTSASSVRIEPLLMRSKKFSDVGRHQLATSTSMIVRSEEHTSELQSLMRISYAVFGLKKKTTTKTH